MKKVAIFIVFALLLSFCAAPVYANGGPPGLPHIFYGDVSINGDPAPDGTQISATVAEGEVLTTSQNPVATENGNYGKDGFPLLVQGYGLSGAITFYVNGVEVEGATATFEAGGGPTEQKLDLVSDITAQKVVTVPAGQTVVIDFSAEANTTITVNTYADKGEAIVTVKKYATNPHPGAGGLPANMLPIFIDISVDNPDAVAWPMRVEYTYTDADIVGLDESILKMYYFKPAAWHECETTGVITATNIIWADMLRAELSLCPVAFGEAVAPEPEPEPEPEPTPGGGGGGGGPVPDTTPPTFSNILASSISETTADIAWRTNEPSTSQVEYWTSPSLLSPLDEAMVIDHLVHLTDLTPGITYYYKTMSRDATGNLAVSDEYTFAIIGAITPLAPAAFSVSNLSVKPVQVQPKEAVTISVSVANTGGTEGGYSLVLEINGVKEAEQSVTVAAGSSEDVSFTVTKEEAGSYNVVVDGLSASFTVVALEVEQPINWPLIGGLIAAAVLAVLLFFRIRRRRAH